MAALVSAHRAALEATVQRLDAAYATARDRLATEIHHINTYIEPYPHTPEDMRDANGRFILLDALITLAQAQAALLQTERPSS